MRTAVLLRTITPATNLVARGAQTLNPSARAVINLQRSLTPAEIPLRWELGKPDLPAYRMSFGYETVDIQPPGGLAAPDCVR